MEIENARFIGAGLMVLTSLLGAYYLVLKIRELHSEKPDPKLTYVTYSHMEKVRAEIMHCISDAIQDLRSLRSESAKRRAPCKNNTRAASTRRAN